MSLVDKIVKRPSFSICGNRLGWITRFLMHMTHFVTWWRCTQPNSDCSPRGFSSLLYCLLHVHMNVKL
nr:MAG TPA: hypothetical protein [Caudoviricetes sp.]